MQELKDASMSFDLEPGAKNTILDDSQIEIGAEAIIKLEFEVDDEQAGKKANPHSADE